MRREEFRDALRRAAEITGDRDLVVLGSQSLHGSFNMAVLEDRVLTASMEVDVLTSDDPEGDKIWPFRREVEHRLGQRSTAWRWVPRLCRKDGWTDSCPSRSMTSLMQSSLGA